jgi:hypothetical protein
LSSLDIHAVGVCARELQVKYTTGQATVVVDIVGTYPIGIPPVVAVVGINLDGVTQAGTTTPAPKSGIQCTDWLMGRLVQFSLDCYITAVVATVAIVLSIDKDRFVVSTADPSVRGRSNLIPGTPITTIGSHARGITMGDGMLYWRVMSRVCSDG